MINKKKKQR